MATPTATVTAARMWLTRTTALNLRVTIRTHYRIANSSGSRDRTDVVAAGSRKYLGCTIGRRNIPGIPQYRYEVVGVVVLGGESDDILTDLEGLAPGSATTGSVEAMFRRSIKSFTLIVYNTPQQVAGYYLGQFFTAEMQIACDDLKGGLLHERLMLLDRNDSGKPLKPEWKILAADKFWGVAHAILAGASQVSRLYGGSSSPFGGFEICANFTST